MSPRSNRGPRARGEKPPPRPPNLGREATRAAALRHLERFSCSTADLTRVLERRILRARDRGVDLDGEAEAEARTVIADTVRDLARIGAVDDARFAESKAASLSRQGKGARAIADKLRRAGIDEDGIAAALERLRADSDGDPERIAAIKLARRRRLGPFNQDPESRAERYRKDLAALARAGFSLDICRAIVDAPTPESLETGDGVG